MVQDTPNPSSVGRTGGTRRALVIAVCILAGTAMTGLSSAGAGPRPAGSGSVPAYPAAQVVPTSGFVPVGQISTPLPRRPTNSDPLTLANWWRSLAGRYPDGAPLVPLALSPGLSETAQRHVDYLAYLRTKGSGYCGHVTDPLYPPPDPGSRSHNVLFCGAALSAAIDGWMLTPLHGGMFVEPAQTLVGFGNSSAGSAAGFDFSQRSTSTYTYPAPNGVMPALRWLGGETPNPSETCPPQSSGSINGPPIMFSPGTFTFTPPGGGGAVPSTYYKVVGWSFTQADTGIPVPACLMSYTTPLSSGSFASAQLYVFPKQPLTSGGRYRVVFDGDPASFIDNSVVGSRLHLDWTFTAFDYAQQVELPRLLDTRPATLAGPAAGGRPAFRGQTIEFSIAAMASIPASASAIALNVAAVDAAEPGFLTVWPCGTDRPEASNVNFSKGQTVANSVIVKLGLGSKICLYTSGSTHLIADLVGYFPAAFAGITPRRVLETRSATGAIGYGGGKPTAGETIEMTPNVADRSAVVALNVTAVDAEAPGYLTAWPCGTDRPVASNVNFTNGQTIANLVIVKPGSDGKICI